MTLKKGEPEVTEASVFLMPTLYDWRLPAITHLAPTLFFPVYTRSTFQGASSLSKRAQQIKPDKWVYVNLRRRAFPQRESNGPILSISYFTQMRFDFRFSPIKKTCQCHHERYVHAPSYTNLFQTNHGQGAPDDEATDHYNAAHQQLSTKVCMWWYL